MLKDYLNKRKISIYSLSKKTNVPYSTLNDLCNGKVEIDNCKVGLVMALKDALNLSFNKLYDICKNEDFIIENKEYNTIAKIRVKNKRYYIEYDNGKEIVQVALFKVKNDNNKFLKDGAEWLLQDHLTETKMEEIYALQFNEKK